MNRTVPSELEQDARAVLLPGVASLAVEPWLDAHLARGGRSLIVAESREEYVARSMSTTRRTNETATDISSFTQACSSIAGQPLLTAIDQEPGGIQRLHELAVELDRADATAASIDDMRQHGRAVAEVCRALGITMTLSPVVDVLTGTNPWLEGRASRESPEVVARKAAAWIEGVQSQGVVAVAKHYPGHGDLGGDPAVEIVRLSLSAEQLAAAEPPFRAAIEAGVGGIMLGPVVVEAIDDQWAASASRPMVARLRGLGFTGLIVTDDLDAPSTCQSQTVPETAVRSLSAGAELLLCHGGPAVDDIVMAIVEAGSRDDQFAGQVRVAADHVRTLASSTGS